MSSFFMTISIIFHLISFILIVILFRRVQFKGQTNISKTKEMLEATLAQLKAENDRLRNELRPNTIQRQKPIQQTKKSNDPQQFKQLLEKQIEQMADEQKQDEYELTFQGKVLQLHERGYSNEEIAQQLNCGKTEVDLVLRFHA